MTRYFTVSVTLFMLTGAVFVLQWIPFTGIFLMFALAMLWSVVLLNLAFFAMLVECALGILPRVLITVPLTYFLGYSALAYQSRVEAEVLIAQAAQEAAAFSAAPSAPQPLQLVTAEWMNSGITAQGLAREIASPAVPLVYWQGRLDQTGAEQVLETAQCTPLKARLDAEYNRLHSTYALSDKIYTGWLGVNVDDYSYNKNNTLNAAYCRFSYSAAQPAGIAQVIISAEQAEPWLGLYKNLTHYTLHVEGQPERRFTAGTVSPLGWIPMPVMGCGLDSGAAKWRCTAGFMRKPGKDERLASINAARLLQAWLGKAETRSPPAPVEVLVSNLWQAFLEKELDLLSRLASIKPEAVQPQLKFSVPNINQSGFPQLMAKPELLPEPLAKALIARLLTHPGAMSETQRVHVEALLAKVSPDFTPAELAEMGKSLRVQGCVSLQGRSNKQLPALSTRYSEAIYQADLAVIEPVLADPVGMLSPRREGYNGQTYPACILTAQTQPARLAPLVPQMIEAIQKMLATVTEPLRQKQYWEYERLVSQIGLVLAAVPDETLAPHKAALVEILARNIDPVATGMLQEYFPPAPRYYFDKSLPGLSARLQPELLAEELQRLDALLPHMRRVTGGKAERVTFKGGRHMFIQLVQHPGELAPYAVPLADSLVTFITTPRNSRWEEAYAISVKHLVYIAGHLLAALSEESWQKVRPALAEAVAGFEPFRHTYTPIIPDFFARLEQGVTP